MQPGPKACCDDGHFPSPVTDTIDNPADEVGCGFSREPTAEANQRFPDRGIDLTCIEACPRAFQRCATSMPRCGPNNAWMGDQATR